MRYRVFLTLQSMLFFILNELSLFLNVIVLVVVIRGRVPHFLSLHFVTALSFIIVVAMLCALSVYVNLAHVNIFLRLGRCL